MSGGHDHGHDHGVAGVSGKRLFITMTLNLAITVAEAIGGALSGSLALISDALHNFTDAMAIVISYVALRLGARDRTESFTFGLKRAEILAAVINAVVLIVVCLFLLKEAYGRLVHPEPIEGGVMMVVAVIGLVANVIGTLLVKSGAKTSMNMRSVYLHLLSDAVSSVTVIVGGALIYFFDIYWVDPIITALICLYIIKEAFEIVGGAVRILMMGAPDSPSLEEVRRVVEAIPAVRDIHHVHLWRLNDRETHLEAHVAIDDMMVSAANEVGKEIERVLMERFKVTHVTLQFESGGCDDASSLEGCPKRRVD